MNTYSDKGQLYLEIKKIATSIAYANSDFYCTKCLDTIDRLCEIVRKYCGYDYYIDVKGTCNYILNSEENENED